MFRFTLGIPGFNDALLPRLVGILGAALLVANHLSDQGTATGAQVTSCLSSSKSTCADGQGLQTYGCRLMNWLGAPTQQAAG